MHTPALKRPSRKGRLPVNGRASDLQSGDRLNQPEFHRRYLTYPEHVRFELIEGFVYMASPLRIPHGEYHPKLLLPLALYESATEGVRLADSVTVILGRKSEVQPDACLRILEEFGGRTTVSKDHFLRGGPEFVAEVAHSSVAIDMHRKKEAYQRAGVSEYLVLCIEEREVHWFNFKSRRTIVPDDQGMMRSRVFPGLWIDGPALLDQNSKRLIATIEMGLASREHAAFVSRLKAHRKSL